MWSFYVEFCDVNCLLKSRKVNIFFNLERLNKRTVFDNK